MVKDFVIAGSIIFNKLILIPSHPQLFLLGRFCFVLQINYASIGLKVKTLFILLFR